MALVIPLWPSISVLGLVFLAFKEKLCAIVGIMLTVKPHYLHGEKSVVLRAQKRSLKKQRVANRIMEVQIFRPKSPVPELSFARVTFQKRSRKKKRYLNHNILWPSFIQGV